MFGTHMDPQMFTKPQGHTCQLPMSQSHDISNSNSTCTKCLISPLFPINCCTEQTTGSGGQITMRCEELNEEEDNGEGDNGEDAQFS